MGVRLTDQGLEIGGKAAPVYSGSVHYWRLERALWPKILDRVAELGFAMIETYIPWSVHETAPGVYDWGQVDERKDIDAFMRLCEERGLWLMVRPGPLINAEMTDFGYPDWVLLDPAVQAKSASGSLHLDAAWGLHPPRPFPVPSYASETFYTAAAGWFDAICPVIARHLAPEGCVVAVQSDNETSYLFHDKPYATDYSDASIALYHRFLEDHHGTIAALNQTYGTRFAAFAEIDPPRDCEIADAGDLPWHLDWVAYKEFQIRWAVSRIAVMLKERGLGSVPIFHDVAYQETTPHDVGRLEADPEIDWVGMNLYCNKEQYRTVATRARFLTGTTRLPFVPEFGCGIWSHHQRTFTPDEHEFVTLSGYMNGLKAINFYMLVERERWQGCPITRHGDFRPDYAPFYQRLGVFLKKYPLWEFERERSTLLLQNYDLGRHVAALSTLHVAHADLLGLPKELFNVELDFGLRWDPRAEADPNLATSWLGQVGRGLNARSIDYDIADTHTDPARFGRYDVLYLQSVDFMDPADQEPLMRYVEAGGTLVVGPGMPALDPHLNPCRVLARALDAPGRTSVGVGELIWAETPQLPALLDRLAVPPAFRAADAAIQLSLHRRGDQALLFAANPTATPITTRLTFDGCRTLTGVWGPPGRVQGDGSAIVSVPSYSVRIWEIQREGART
ncbi:MAG: beta-galactosidase [Thermomicrobiales bacterium]|nr:beta-galactosidase [Thermomicrobiales bacterium]